MQDTEFGHLSILHRFLRHVVCRNSPVFDLTTASPRLHGENIAASRQMVHLAASRDTLHVAALTN